VAALATTPAGPGFLGAPALLYLHEGGGTSGAEGDGLWLAAPLGPVGTGLSVEWLRPGDGGGPRHRRTSLGLALGDGRAVSLGATWRWWSSPDPALERLHALDLGLTVRPSRAVSLAAAVRGFDARLAGERVPLRYDLGLAVRAWGDRLTLAADLLADDLGGEPFRSTHLALGTALDLGLGVSGVLQLLVPLRQQPSGRDQLSAVASLAWREGHTALVASVLTRPDGRTGWQAGMLARAERPATDGSGRVAARFRLARSLEPRDLLFLQVAEADPFGRLLERLRAAGEDAEVGVVVLEIDRLPLSAGTVEELRRLVLQVKARKPVLAWLAGGGTKEYWLATAATAVAGLPAAPLRLDGIAWSGLYLREGLSRLGVAVEVAKAGAWKSAPEPLTREGPSPEARQSTASILDDLSGRILGDVAGARALEPGRVRALVDRGALGPEEARQAGLLDDALWPDELEAWAGRAARRPVRLVDWAPPPRPRRWGRPPVVALIRIDGAIAPGRSRAEPLGVGRVAGAESVSEALRRAAQDREARAIVLRIDSPGGDALASDLIWRAVRQARGKKPVVVSMGDVAASGGYLAAVGADLLLAQASTLTGSIGVFALKPDASGLLEKLGVRRAVETRGALADALSPAKPWSPAERAAVERLVGETYQRFLARVAEGRRLSPEAVEAVAGGRVWTGAQALPLGLVDRLGGLEEAVDAARELAGLRPGEPVELRRYGGAGRVALDLVPDGAAALARAAAALPELRALALLGELGPVLALPVDWLPGAPPDGP
jgi:protease-4